MDNTKSLVGSKTFWSSLLALIGMVSMTYHIDWLSGWAGNPDTVNICVTAAGIIMGVVSRYIATKQITSVLPQSSPAAKVNAHWIPVGVAIGLALVLAGCSTLSTLGVIAGTSVSPQAALVSANSFDALETVATGYLQFPACGATASLACRDPAAVANIVPAVRSGRAARNQIEALLKTSNGGPIPIASYNTLEAAITSLQAVYAQFNIKTN